LPEMLEDFPLIGGQRLIGRVAFGIIRFAGQIRRRRFDGARDSMEMPGAPRIAVQQFEDSRLRDSNQARELRLRKTLSLHSLSKTLGNDHFSGLIAKGLGRHEPLGIDSPIPLGIDRSMGDRITPPEAVKKAVSIMGSQGALARLCGVAQPSVFKWIRKGKALPAEHVLKVEAATGIPKEDLRPDLYPRDAAVPTGVAAVGAGGLATASRADSVPDSLSGLTA
jgi:DNA-binding transcriptional regulator YdaS (Cro superfamily)